MRCTCSAYCAHQKKDTGAAIAHIRRAIDLMPANAAYPFSLANILMTSGRLAEAADCCRQSLRFEPNHPQANNTLGVILQGMDQMPLAIASYRRALSIDPENLSALNNLATALLHQKQLAEAGECLRRALQIKPDYAMAHVNLGNVLKEQGNLAEATLCFRKAVELSPNMPEAHFNLGNASPGSGSDCRGRRVFSTGAATQSQICGSCITTSVKLSNARDCWTMPSLNTGKRFVCLRNPPVSTSIWATRAKNRDICKRPFRPTKKRVSSNLTTTPGKVIDSIQLFIIRIMTRQKYSMNTGAGPNDFPLQLQPFRIVPTQRAACVSDIYRRIFAITSTAISFGPHWPCRQAAV